MLFNTKLLNTLTQLNLTEYIEKIKAFNDEYELKDFASDDNIDIDKFKSFYENDKVGFDNFINDYIEYYNLNIKLHNKEIEFGDIKDDFLHKYYMLMICIKEHQLLNIKVYSD